MRRALLIVALVACGGETVDALDGGGLSSAQDASFPCGDATCNATTSYCKHVSGGPPPGVDFSKCVDFDGGCHACACLPGSSQACACSADAAAILVSCNVP